MEQRCQRFGDNSRPVDFLDSYERQREIAKGCDRRSEAGSGECDDDISRHRYALSLRHQSAVIAARQFAGARDRRGFTMIEIIVSFVISLIVLGSVAQMMIVQGRGYRKQREQVDVRETAREAAALLSWDLRQASVAESPFAVMGANNVAIRSPRGLGTI